MVIFDALSIVFTQPDMWMPQLQRHIVLSGLAMIIAIGVAVPVGAWLTRREELAFAVVSIANLGRTIPSLALLALVYPFVGTGFTPAIIALVALGIPPILLQTYTAIREIDADTVDAAEGMGMGSVERLVKVELPMASPLILSGIRTAGVQVVASATLAALIGGGGLGELVLSGLSNMEIAQLLAGAILVAILAVVVEVTLTLFERKVLPEGIRVANAAGGGSGADAYRASDALTPQRWGMVAAGAAGIAAVIIVGGSIVTDVLTSPAMSAIEPGEKPAVTIGSKDFTEQRVLGEIYAQALEAQGFPVTRKFGLAETATADAALDSGEVDIYPEYDGTALVAVHNAAYVSGMTGDAVLQAISKDYRKRNIGVLDPTPFSNGNVIVVTRETSDRYGLETLSDLRKAAPRMRLGAMQEFQDRPDGLRLLRKEYGISFAEVRTAGLDRTYPALLRGKIDAIHGFETDGQIARHDLVVLADDRQVWPEYHALPVVRQEVLEAAGPALTATLNAASAGLTPTTMRRLNDMVAHDGMDPGEAAASYLTERGLLDVGARPEVVIGSKDFTESLVLGELYAQALATRGFTVGKRLNLGSTGVVDAALARGDIDIYPEYTGTSLTAVFKGELQPGATRESIAESVSLSYGERGIAMLEPTPFSNGYAIVVTAKTAKKHGLKTISDLAKISGNLSFASVPGFNERPDGLPLLKSSYGLDFKSVKTYDQGLKYKAVVDGKIGAAIGYETDGQIARFKLVALQDDLQIWPPYQAAPLVGEDLAGEADADLAATVDNVTRLLDTPTMQHLNNEVDENKREPRDVARELLVQHNLLYPEQQTA